MAGDETALIVEVPAAEVVVGRHRAGLDRAAALGVPAHVTVLYPFRPVEVLSREDHDRLDDVFGGVPAFTLVLSRCAWFGDAVLYLAPEDPAPLRALTGSVARAFPEHPPYEGTFEDVVAHLTVGHDHPREVLAAAEREVVRGLPITELVGEVSLWRGPPLLPRRRPGGAGYGGGPWLLRRRGRLLPAAVSSRPSCPECGPTTGMPEVSAA